MPVGVEVDANQARLKLQVSTTTVMLSFTHSWHYYETFVNQHASSCEMSDTVARTGFNEAQAEIKKERILIPERLDASIA